jgi:hypothetical protein
MSSTVSHEAITCSSCEYRYSASASICPMCGKAAPAIEPMPLISATPDQTSGTNQESVPARSENRRPLQARLGKLVPALVALVVLVIVASLFHKTQKDNPPKESVATTELASTSGQPVIESADQRPVVHNSARGAQHVVAAKMVTAQPIDTAKAEDPAELWKAVKKGSVNAEVALANLYLEGEAVPRNCEQAHMLLQTASTKGSKAADTLLKNGYPERCQ